MFTAIEMFSMIAVIYLLGLGILWLIGVTYYKDEEDKE